MIAFNYEHRPSGKEVLSHIIFWDHDKKLRLIMDLSDHLEFLQTSHPTVRGIEKLSREFKVLEKCKNDWSSQLDDVLLSELNKYRKYNLSSISDLMRFIRNKRNHFRDLPKEGQALLSKSSEKFLRYFTLKFKKLTILCFVYVRNNLQNEDLFKSYFR
jgi:serine/threonine-protein kinase/endoribonuclease IRE1